MKIGMLSSDWGDFAESSPGGCTNIRMLIPAAAMQKNGVDVVAGEFGWIDSEGFVACHTIERAFAPNRGPIINPKNYSGDLDVIIIKLWMWHEYRQYIERAQELGQTIIIDIDDWFDGLPVTNIAFETTHPKNDKLWNRNHMLASFQYANGLITSTQFLHDYYKKSNAHVIKVRNSLDPNDFIRRADTGKDRPVIGWAGMMLWRRHDIEELRTWLGDFLEKHDLYFYHAGINPENPRELAEIANFNPDRLFGVGGCSARFYGNILLPMDIGIVPLEKVSFNEAKSGLKGMEYAFSGIPFVATDTEEYKELVADGAGNLAKKPRDWIRRLEALLDPEIRKEQSDRGHQVVMEKYNINTVVNEWIDTIEYIRRNNPKAR